LTTQPLKQDIVFPISGIISRPYGLTLYKNFIIWTEFDKGQILQMNLKTNVSSIINEENPHPFSVKVFSIDNQPENDDHSCLKADCEDFCFITPSNVFSSYSFFSLKQTLILSLLLYSLLMFMLFKLFD